jgi:UDP-2-acetamido-3-amino-2,3-dideoxy-glucuronate N-acetyltransferase
MPINNDVILGKGVKIYHPELVNLYGCRIGDYASIGAFVEIKSGVQIGTKVKIQAGVFIPDGVTIEDEVFIGPHVCFTNDIYPRATSHTGSLKTEADWEVVTTLVKKYAAIGANATILCGITIGEGSLIGAGSVVTKDVPAWTVVAGNPAKVIGKVKDRRE